MKSRFFLHTLLLTLVLAIAAHGQIAVEQPAGTGLTSASSTRDFGSAIIGAAGSTLTLTVRNTGPGTLGGLAVSVDGAAQLDYTVDAAGLPTSLAACTSGTFTVPFTPSAAGPRAATSQIASGDPSSPFALTLNGTGATEPPIVRTITATDLGWYASSGYHDPGSLNYFTGNEFGDSAPEKRSFYVFAIPVMAPEETLISAELQLFNPTNN